MFNHIAVEIDQLKRKNTDKGRRYETPDGKLYPSVTTILSHKSKPSIQEWRKRVGAKEADKISRIASVRGTKIHTLCEDALNNKPEDVSKLSILDQEMYKEFRPLLNDIDNIHCLEEKNLYPLRKLFWQKNVRTFVQKFIRKVQECESYASSFN